MARSVDEPKRSTPMARCGHCYHDHPGERFRHWANFPEEQLEAHLLNQFGDEQRHWALREIDYIRAEKARLREDWKKHCNDDGSPIAFGDYYVAIYGRRYVTPSDIVAERAKNIAPEEAKKQLSKTGFNVNKRKSL